MTFEQFGWLYKNHIRSKKEDYEVLAHVISVGYSRTQTKKKIKLFGDESKKQNRVEKITREEKEAKIKKLQEIFG